MGRRQLAHRVAALTARSTARLDRFRPFAAAVVRFGGEEPTPERVDALVRLYAGGYRQPER